jgi:uncharacterized protein YjbJ (UPF0337 family)
VASPLFEALEQYCGASSKLTSKHSIHGGGPVNKDRAKGILDEAVGSAKRKAGEWTDNPKLQAEGVIQQAKGEAEGAWGKAKEAVVDAVENTEVRLDAHVKLGLKNSTADSKQSNCI